FAHINPAHQDDAVVTTGTQIEIMRVFAEQCGYEVTNIFIDKGVDSCVGKRLAYQKMLGLANEQAKPFDAVLVWRDNNLSRYVYNYINVRLSELGVTVVPVKESGNCVNIDNAMKDFSEYLSMCFSMSLSRDIRRGIKAAKERRKLAAIANNNLKEEVV
ncbi:MAG: recombinase family protein, partial [bacterium]